MNGATFDTLAYARRLEEAGFSKDQAEAQTEALAEILGGEMVTKRELQIELAPVKTDLIILKWMTGLLLASQLTILFKIFS